MGWNAAIFSFVFAVLLKDAAANITWTTSDNNLNSGFLRVCAGSDVYLNWRFTLPDGELEYNIDWTFLGPNMTEDNLTFIASSSHGHLFDGNGKYEKTTNAGIKIVNVSKTDEGNYSVTVVTQTGRRTLQSYTVNTSVYLRVDEPVEILDGKLLIEYGAGNNGDLILKCGHFLKYGNPPAIVTWTYGNTTQQASSPLSGFFQLSQQLSNLDSPYVCSVAFDRSSVCNASYVSASVTLDSLDVKLSLLEARLERLESLHNINGTAPAACGTSGCSQSDVADVKALLATVTTDNNLLERRVQSLNNTLHNLQHNATTAK